MERKVIFRDGQDLDPADFNNAQAFVQDAIDHVVNDGITAGRKFAGFVGAISAVAEVTIAPGRLYSAGRVYRRADAVVKSFLTALPVATKKSVLVVVYGQEIETDVRPREFLINEETGASEPRQVATEAARICNVTFASGQEAADPIDPQVDVGALAIARIILSPAGVVSITMLAENRLASVQSVGDRVGSLEDFRARIGPQTTALGSDLASIKGSLGGLVGKEVYGRTLGRLAAIEAKVGIPSAAVDSTADFFLDKRATDDTFAGYDARVSEGIRFARAAVAETSLAIFDALNPKASIVNGLMLPAHTLEERLQVGPFQSEVQVASFTYQSHEMVQQTMSRTRIRYGQEQTVCTNSAWWQTGQYDATQNIFTKDGETFTVSLVAEFGDVPGHNLERVQSFWEDTYEEPYWAQVTVPHTVNGAQVGETFLNANAGWLGAISLNFTRLADNGGITLALCETNRGAPDLTKVISYTTIDRASLKLGKTMYPIDRVFLQGGKRYAFVVITAANHWLAATAGENFPEGTLFYVLDGAYQQGDGTKDLCFSLHFAKFTSARAVIEMAPLQLAGGIATLDILADSVVPASCDLSYEVQVGGTWTPIAATTNPIFGAGGIMPALAPLRAVFTGTPDTMPGLKLTGSRVRVSRPKLALVHVSSIRTLPGSGSTQIRVLTRFESWDAAHHTAAVKLRTGAGYATVVTPSSYVDVVVDSGIVERTTLFNLGAAVTTYRIQCEATTDSALRAFHFGWRKDFAL